jgi:hypothetical protein
MGTHVTRQSCGEGWIDVPTAKVRDTNDGGCVLDASAHALSRALISQSATVTCCTVTRAVVLLVLLVNTVFTVYCVNVVFT